MSRFSALVERGLAKGMSRAAAERAARDDLFDEDEPPELLASNQMSLREFVDAADGGTQTPEWLEPGLHKGVDELWSELQRAWEQRASGDMELADILEEINELLEGGIISSEQFLELLQRVNAEGPALIAQWGGGRQKWPPGSKGSNASGSKPGGKQGGKGDGGWAPTHANRWQDWLGHDFQGRPPRDEDQPARGSVGRRHGAASDAAEAAARQAAADQGAKLRGAKSEGAWKAAAAEEARRREATRKRSEATARKVMTVASSRAPPSLARSPSRAPSPARSSSRAQPLRPPAPARLRLSARIRFERFSWQVDEASRAVQVLAKMEVSEAQGTPAATTAFPSTARQLQRLRPSFPWPTTCSDHGLPPAHPSPLSVPRGALPSRR